MRKFDDYSLGKCLHSRTHRELYLGVRRSDGREVVLKTDLRDSRDNGTSYAEREFATLRSAAGAGVVAALELIGGTPPTLVLERVPGLTLGEWVESAFPPTPQAFVEIALQLAGALSRVHAARMVHCHVSPDNVMVDPETHRSCLIGFGHARSLGSTGGVRELAKGGDGFRAPDHAYSDR